MDKYSALTKYLPALEADSWGSWQTVSGGDGTPENPYQFPYVSHSKVVLQFILDVHDFVLQQPEFDSDSYHDILKAHGIDLHKVRIQDLDVSSLNGLCMVALLLWAVRSERFCEGFLLDLLEMGLIQKWLLRLKEIDEA